MDLGMVAWWHLVTLPFQKWDDVRKSSVLINGYTDTPLSCAGLRNRCNLGPKGLVLIEGSKHPS